MSSSPRWTDNHCHLPHDRDELDEVVADARRAGVERFVNVATDLASSAAVARASAGRDDVWVTAGVHPHEAHTVFATGGGEGGGGRADLTELDALLGDPVRSARVVAVGECGLDYHYDHSPRDAQRAVFAAQVRLAHAHDLALVIHTREAWDDTFAILDAEGVPGRTVLHCFTGGPDEARLGLERGLLLSFSGIITFPSAPEVLAAAAQCPLDRVMVETDAPYLAPVPHRGRANRPALVPLVGAAVAEARGCPVDAVAEASWDNAAAFYRLS